MMTMKQRSGRLTRRKNCKRRLRRKSADRRGVIRMPKITDRAIRAMPYESRLKNYEKEKDALFLKIKGMSAADVAEAHRKLAEKWKV